MKFFLLIPLLLVSLIAILGHSPKEGIISEIRCLESERQALLKFKDKLVDTYGRLSSWGDEEHKRDCCKWRGVQCHNRTNHVIRLDLQNPVDLDDYDISNASLKGMISASLLELQHLQYLNLSYNDFGCAPIPDFIGSLSELRYLNLASANFSGPIPDHLGNLSKLLYLDLRDNYNCHSKSLDWVSHLYSLEYLDLSYIDFGHAPIPDFIGSLSELRYLNLASANFSGPIPDHLGNLSKLSHLDLRYNDNCYSKSLDWVSHLLSLKYLDFSSTNLSKANNWLQTISKLTSIKELHMADSALADIPPSSLPSINASTPLSTIDLARNSFNVSTLALIHWFSNFSNTGLTSIDFGGNRMPGPIPDVFANMASLTDLSLYDVGLEGGIPKYFGNMSNLIYIELARNNLTGELSELMMNLSGPIEDKLDSLVLYENGISGSFSNMSKFSSLEELNLARNQLKGSIHEGYLKLPHLLFLDLSLNKLIGPLPNLSFSSSLEELILHSNKFNGTLTESIGRLFKLESLSIGSNLFEGIITEAFMSNLSQLRALDLSSNPPLIVKFSPHWVPPFQLWYLRLRYCRLGPHVPLWLKTQEDIRYIDISCTGISDIPSWFGRKNPNLAYLNASNNQITGIFPHFGFGFLRMLDLSRNNIFSSINFWCHAGDDLELLDLSDNNLAGHLPDCFSHFKSLRYLNLASNKFSGKIPHSFGSLSSLSLLHLRNNSFSGELPTSIANCANLTMIDVGDNKLTGKIPVWIGDQLSLLKVLILRFNEFYGSIPSNLCGLVKIQVLDLSANKISGVIPNCLHRYTAMTLKKNENILLTIDDQYQFLEYPLSEINQLQSAYFMWKGNEVNYANNLGLVELIDLSSNNLVGQIPSNITKLVGLVGLNFSKNKLIGSIPGSIGHMNSLDFLDLSRNQLSGNIPISLGELGFLGVLNLSYNNLSGKIPSSNKLLTFSESSYMGNLGLCGPPLNKSCPGDVFGQDSDLDNNSMRKEKFEDDKIVNEGFYIALGLGFLVGFWGIFGTILLNKAMQYAFVKVVNSIEDFVYVRLELTKARLFRHFEMCDSLWQRWKWF